MRVNKGQGHKEKKQARKRRRYSRVKKIRGKSYEGSKKCRYKDGYIDRWRNR